MRESDIERAVCNYVNSLGGYHRKVQWVGRRSAPDRIVMLRGETIFIEFKAPGETPDSGQTIEFSRIRRVGGMRVEVVDNIDDGKNVVDSMGVVDAEL